MPEKIRAVVVGAGPAGLALSYELQRAGVEHLVLERGRVAQTWRARWDSFCLVTPNWTVMLPGGTYDGPDPDGYMPRDQLVAHFEHYARSFEAPIREGVDVRELRAAQGGGFVLETSEGDITSDVVVLATGAYQKQHRPPGADAIPARIDILDTEQYTNPGALRAGRVLVVGSGQTGCQIAEELHESGRDVVLACGKAPWVPRRVEGRDIVKLVAETPFLDASFADLPSPMGRLAANFQTSGRDGGHDLHYRTLRARGVTMTGRFLGVDDRSIRFADDLHESVAFGDARYADIRTMLQKVRTERGEPLLDLPDPEPFDADGIDEIPLAGLSAVIFTAGFRPDYERWVRFPDAFDEWGFPIQRDGASAVVPGLFFIGTHFLRKRKSATLFGMAEDAAVVARVMATSIH